MMPMHHEGERLQRRRAPAPCRPAGRRTRCAAAPPARAAGVADLLAIARPGAVACLLRRAVLGLHSASNTLPTSSACLTSCAPAGGSARRARCRSSAPARRRSPAPATVPRTFRCRPAARRRTSITVPPVNSIEKCRPRVTRKNTAARKVSNEMTLNTSACRMNGMSRWMRKNSICLSSCSAVQCARVRFMARQAFAPGATSGRQTCADGDAPSASSCGRTRG